MSWKWELTKEEDGTWYWDNGGEAVFFDDYTDNKYYVWTVAEMNGRIYMKMECRRCHEGTHTRDDHAREYMDTVAILLGFRHAGLH